MSADQAPEGWKQFDDFSAGIATNRLPLTDALTGKPLAKSSEVGPAYLALVRRFRNGFPGHPRPGLAAQALAQGHLTPPAPPPCVRGSAGG